MRRSTWRFWILATALIAVNAGGWIWYGRQGDAPSVRAPLRVTSVWPVSDADTAERLSVSFDRAIVATAEVGRIVPDPPFEIEPRPAGRWVYGAPERIDFQLDAPLPPGRVFTVSTRADGDGAIGPIAGPTSHEFRTRALAVESCRLVAADREAVHIAIDFNQPVDPRSVAQRLAVRSGKGDVVSVDVLTDRVGARVDLRAPRPGGNAIEIAIDEDLTGAGATRSLAGDWTRRLEIPVAFALLRAAPRAVGATASGTVDLEFSAGLDSGQTAPTIDVSPPVSDLDVVVRHRSIRLRGGFRPATRYEATVPAGVLADGGAVLERATSVAWTMPPPRPALRFDHQEGVLSPHGNRRITGQVLNVGAIRVTASRVHANNLVDHVRGAHASATSRDLLSREITIDAPPNELKAFAVPLDELLPDLGPGVYRVAARALDRRWMSTSALVRLSDLALTTKEDTAGALVWVTAIRSGAPLPGVTVTAWTYNNQPLATATSGPDGIARLTFPPKHPDGPLYLVTAAHGDDVSYIRPARRAWSIEGVDQSGRPRIATYDVMLCTERGAYRPGDPIHVSGIVRGAGGDAPEGLPLTIRLARPDGRIVLDTTIVTGAQGTFALTRQTEAAEQTGTYRFTASVPGSDAVLGAVETSVEAFVPVRIALEAAATQPSLGPAAPLRVDASAQYLFGRAAAGLPVTLDVTFAPERYVSKRHPDFVFGTDVEPAPHVAKTIRGTTGDDGRVSLEGSPAPDGRSWRASGMVTVTEIGGRSVSHVTSCVADGVGHHVGLGRRDGTVVTSGRTVDVPWCLVSGDDAPAPATALTFELDRVESEWVAQEGPNGRRWTSVERTHRVTTDTVAPDAADGALSVRCPSPGRYRLTVTETALGAKTSILLHAVARVDDTPALTRPDRVEIVLDQERHVPGESVGVVVRSPFAGWLLVTLEDANVRTHRVIQLTQRTATLTLPLPADVRGDAFVTATVVRPVEPESTTWRPHGAIGVARVRTRHDAHALPLVLAAPTEGRPGERVAVEAYVAGIVDPARPPMVQLWAVDEGILLATDYATPSPLDHFLAPRRSTVRSADLHQLLLPDHRDGDELLVIGGDDANWRARARRGPVPTRGTVPAVVWHGWRPVDASGRAEFEITLPETFGAMRIMAVAVEGDRYAHAESDVTVTAPLIVSATWPRAVAPGDCFRVPVRVRRTNGTPVHATLTATLGGSADLRSAGPFDVDLTERTDAIVWLEVDAHTAGPVTVALDLTGADERARERASFVVRSPAPYRALHEIVRLETPVEHRFTPPAELEPGATRCALRVGAAPRLALEPAVRELLDYPYGCLEQTTSRLYALLDAPSLLEAPSAERSGDGDQSATAVRAMIDAGLSRIWSMQTPTGGLSYWPGGNTASLWASAYAAHFLERAAQRGYAVDGAFRDDLADYLRTHLHSGRSSATPNTRAMICRVLAERGAPDVATMSALGDRLDKLDIAGRSHLAGAWLAAGRRERALAALPDETYGLSIATTTSRRPTSQDAQDAVLLDVLLDLDPDHPWIAGLVERLESARHNGSWGTTLATAATLSALTRYEAHHRPDSEFDGSMMIGSRSLPFDHMTPGRLVYDAVEGAATLRADGYGPVYATFTAEGPSSSAARETIDRSLRVRAAWFDRDGAAIESDVFRVGDLVQVEISLSATRAAGNVAVVVPLPGGFEIEHPRLVTSAGAGRTETADADRVEFLDDRVLLFSSASSKSRSFRFAIRAVTAGSFHRPAVEATCMYDPGITSIHAGGHVDVEP